MQEALQTHTSSSSFFWSFDIYETKEKGAYIRNSNDDPIIARDDDNRYPVIAAWDKNEDEMLLVRASTNDEFGDRQEEVLDENLLTQEEADQTEDEWPYAPARHLHPLTTESVMLPEVGEGEEGDVPVEEYWHPFRFDGSAPELHGEGDTDIDYREAATITGQMFRGMVSTTEDGDITKRLGEDAEVAITNEYLDGITDVLADPGSFDTGFEDIYDQAKMVHHLAEDDNQYVVFGTHDNPLYVKVDPAEADETVIDDIWEDEEGKYNMFSKAYNSLEPVERRNSK